MADAPQEAGTINTDQAARLLMVTPERVRQLVREGWIARIDRDRYRLVDVVQGYIRFRNHEDRRANKSGAESRIRDARADEINLRMGVRAGQLIEHAEHVAIIEELCGLVRAELGGLPARLTRDLGERRKTEQAIYELLTRLAARADEMARVGNTRREAVASVADDDTGPVGGAEQVVSTERVGPGST